MKASLKVRLFDPKFYLIITFVICILSTIVVYPFLPSELPMQFSATGEVNWTLPKALGVLCIPAIALFLSAYNIKEDKLTFVSIIPIILILLVDIGVLYYTAFWM